MQVPIPQKGGKKWQTFSKTIRNKSTQDDRNDSRQTNGKKTRCEYLQNLEQGAKVKVNKAYAESGFLYFVSYVDKSTVLLTDNKTKARQGYEQLYSVYDVIVNK